MNSTQNWTHHFRYPVRFQAYDGQWHTLFTAHQPLDLEYRLDSYHFPTEGISKWRLIDAAGNIAETTEPDIQLYHQNQTQAVTKATQPLLQFVQSSPTNALETATEILQGALRAKHYAISPESVIQIGVEGLDSIVLTEFEDSVVARIQPIPGNEIDTLSLTIWHTQDNPSQISFSPSIDLEMPLLHFLVLITASIIRDFWVAVKVHHSLPNFIRSTQKTRERVGSGKERKLVVRKTTTFLPRFQVDLHQYRQASKREVEHTIRVQISPHMVSGHIRQLPEGHQASEEAKAHAREFGFQLHEGETFVRPHEKGVAEQFRTYRSRSAFQLLFGSQSNPSQ